MDKSTQLYNGLSVPSICCGTGIIKYNIYRKPDFSHWFQAHDFSLSTLKSNAQIASVMKNAMRNGVFIDTSSAYGKAEELVGDIVRLVPNRKKIVLCSKLSANDQLKYGKNIKKIYNGSLKRMGNIKALDVYLMHWPVPKNYLDVWKQMEELYRSGLVGAIGVCNCHIHHLEEILTYGEIKPMIHQMELHPLFTQEEERKFCQAESIKVMAYTSTARNDDRLINSRVLKKIADRKSKSIVQVVLRWHVQLGNIPIVSTTNYKHYLENTNIYDFTLSEEEMDQISRININSRLRYDSDNCDFLV